MPFSLFRRIHEWERKLSKSFGTDISTPRARRLSRLHFLWFDHGILRGLWTNMEEIAPGVWRSNQPSAARMDRLHRMGIRTILNLRGGDRYAHYLFQREAADRLGIEMIDIKIYARKLVPREQFMKLFEAFDLLETRKPFLLHCKSGADRAGLAGALWLLDKEGASLDEARRMLSLRYVHLRHTKTGLMGHVLDCYEAARGDSDLSVREWFATRYDPVAVTASFHAKRGWPAPSTTPPRMPRDHPEAPEPESGARG